MATTAIVGRTNCPECGFPSAHVKRSDKVLYRFCPECSSQYMARGPRLEALLLEKTRLNEQVPAVATATGSAPSASADAQAVAVPAPAPTEPQANAPAAPIAVAPPAKKRLSLFTYPS